MQPRGTEIGRKSEGRKEGRKEGGAINDEVKQPAARALCFRPRKRWPRPTAEE